MPGQGQPLIFEDLLQTVQESERGRWFLSEFENRLRSSQSTDILNAIQRLENVISEQKQSGSADSALVARARSAIAAARREIAAMEGAKQQLTEEGRLFAKLADMARTAFASDTSGSPLVTAGVTRALRLVDEIEQELSPAGPSKAATFFPPESDIFEQPPKQVQAVIAPVLKPALREVDRGAKLVFEKAGAAAEPAKPAEEASAKSPEPQHELQSQVPVPESAAPSATVTSITPPPAKTSRVVIIRRKPEELMDVPMVDETAADSAA